jgi:hypothetical protein
MANHPTDTTTSDWPINYIAVARIDTPADATVEWTMAAYNDGTVGIPGGTGKAILDGPGGNVIGRLVTLDNVTGGAPLGPSMSSPMMDSVGNLYFISAIEILNTNGSTNFNSGVIRAVYDPDTFCYELDLLMTLGGTPNFGPMFYDPLAVHGANSDLNWTVNFMGVADSNSIDSGTAFSGNISASAHLGMDPAQITDTRDVRAMGGMVLSVEIVYDSDQDGDLDECSNPFTPPSDDETYNVLLYLSANPAAGPTCPPVENCGDQDDNGIRDDACAWYECNAGVCGTVNKTTQADIGGANGACPTDTACDGNDRFHALNCFQNKNTLGVPPYPCEASTPLALNVDAGGPSTCVLDGVCDGNDAFHALNCFENDWFDGTPNYQCDCGPQPTPPSGPLARAGQAQLTLRAPDKAQPGDVVSVDVHLGSAVDALRGYQLHLGTAGGDSGELELVDISVNTKRRDYAFAGAPGTWNAFNVSSGQMVVGMDAPLGVPARAGSYLATFTYRVPKNAEGAFIFEVRYDGNSVIPQDRTFLFGPHAGLMNVTVPPAARMDVVGRHGLDKRLGARD